MTDHVQEATTAAPAFGELLRLEDVADLQSEVKVLCSGAVSEPMRDAAAKMARANYTLSLCGLAGSCNAQEAKGVRRYADQAASLVGEVRNRTES